MPWSWLERAGMSPDLTSDKRLYGGLTRLRGDRLSIQTTQSTSEPAPVKQ